jgi:hypothetical protein
MPEATMTSGQPENDSARPSLTLEDAENIDFYDPDDEQETVEADQDQHSESETDEADDGQESEDIEASEDGDDVSEDEEQGEENSTPEPDDAVTITMSNGERLTLSELKKGYFREADYTRQKQAVSTKEKNLEALSARVTASVDAIADFLSKQIPEAPDPSLAMTNPGEFVQKKAMHDAAMAQVNAILSQAGQVKDVANTLTNEQRSELLRSENAKLAEAFPQTATQEGRKQFFDHAAGAARELGWSNDEIGQVVDHRMFKLAHYAALGLAAEKAKAKAKAKVANVPPVAQQKRQQGANAAKAAKNKDAMKRLARTGSIQDAILVDFD